MLVALRELPEVGACHSFDGVQRFVDDHTQLRLLDCQPHRQTAQIIGAYHPQAPIHIAKYLNEIQTAYQGTSRDEVSKIDWNFYDNRLQESDETREQVLARVQKQLRLTLRRHAGQKVVWVAHGDLVIMTAK